MITSSAVGMETEAPLREMAIDDAFVAVLSAVAKSLPLATELRKYPVNVSPAAVVSTLGASIMG